MRLRLFRNGYRAHERILITLGTQPGNGPYRDITEEGMLAKRFSGMNVGQVDLDERNRHARKCIAQRDAGVGKCSGINHDRGDAVDLGFVNRVDQLMLGVALQAFELMIYRLGDCAQPVIDVVERVVTVNFRFPTAQQIQIRAMQDQYFGHDRIQPLKEERQFARYRG